MCRKVKATLKAVASCYNEPPTPVIVRVIKDRVKQSVGLATAATESHATTRALRFDPATIAANQIEKEHPGSSDSDAVSPDKDPFSCSLCGVNWENAARKSVRSYPLDWRAST